MAEVKKAAKTDPALGAEGAVKFLEKVAPALEQVDSSSGAIGTAVNNAIDALVPIIASAPVDDKQRDKWLQRVWKAYEEDGYCYLDIMGDRWGELCASPKMASRWVDHFIDTVRIHWKEAKRSPGGGGYYRGVSPCLSSLLVAGRYQELIDLLELAPFPFWYYHRYGFFAIGRLHGKEAAMAFANGFDCKNDQFMIERDCEEFLLSIGEVEEAYQRFGLRNNQSNTHINTFRALVKRYPHKEKTEILMDLIGSSPGAEGKWFATARKLGFRDLAMRLATQSSSDPQTLNRAAKDTVESDPEFSLAVSMASIHWLCQGGGYEITGFDVLTPYRLALSAAERLGKADEVKQKIEKLILRT
ncbi:hypothetical protein [Magnetofaba australis]|uniref:hypothetical protein n=1 Tax=Magnetofaba australis TaxID=1472297 RepID=UPI00117D44DC|nr:hypothetical protein [Magnetofaba australis]